jgi:hypothetical protein
MGWLVHDEQLASWVPLRLFWTVAGIVMGVLSMRLLWPARALPQAWRSLFFLLQCLARTLERVAGQLEAPGMPSERAGSETDGDWLQDLRQQLGSLRAELPAVESELGSPACHHPQTRLLLTLLDTCATLITVVEGMLRHAPTAGATGTLVTLQEGEADVLRAVADRLRLWGGLISQPDSNPLRVLPLPPWRAPISWQDLQPLLTDPSLSGVELPRLRRHASRLVLCGQAERAIGRTEALWRSLTSRPRNPRQLLSARGVLS